MHAGQLAARVLPPGFRAKHRQIACGMGRQGLGLIVAQGTIRG